MIVAIPICCTEFFFSFRVSLFNMEKLEEAKSTFEDGKAASGNGKSVVSCQHIKTANRSKSQRKAENECVD